ncbi:thioredoxin domain-containing protein [Myxococcota bacterium]|nr:thioredoxin domain-containing protein [Myxococcota bacterium]MBU1429890.1 thioredoxin domain-containing protein [Myxococcota bacterium]MBU1900347.1 thioredoxin domain-containing protein [Myxococcota bacterium]
MRIRFYLFTLLALTGLYVADRLVGIHILSLLGAADSGICAQLPGFSCVDVARSRFSALFGVPIAVYGEGFFLTILISAALARFKEDIEGLSEGIFASALLAVLGSIALGLISKLYINKLCPYCLMLYGVNLALFLTAVIKIPGGLLSALKGAPRVFKRPGAWIMLGLMIALTSVSFGLYKYRLSQAKAEARAQKAQEERVYFEGIEVGMAPRIGPASALVQVVEFSDFECPYCGKFAQTLKEIHEENPGLFSLHFKHTPMAFHERAQPAARAAICAQRQGRFWPMHDTLFERRKQLSDADLEGYAKALGLDMEAYTACLKDPATQAQINADLAQAKALGVGGTPTFFVNGWRYSGALPKAHVEGILSMAAAKARKAAKAQEAPAP